MSCSHFMYCRHICNVCYLYTMLSGITKKCEHERLFLQALLLTITTTSRHDFNFEICIQRSNIMAHPAVPLHFLTICFLQPKFCLVVVIRSPIEGVYLSHVIATTRKYMIRRYASGIANCHQD